MLYVKVRPFVCTHAVRINPAVSNATKLRNHFHLSLKHERIKMDEGVALLNNYTQNSKLAHIFKAIIKSTSKSLHEIQHTFCCTDTLFLLFWKRSSLFDIINCLKIIYKEATLPWTLRKLVRIMSISIISIIWM